MYYLIILVLLFLVELFYFRIADKCNIIDKPNELAHPDHFERGRNYFLLWRISLLSDESV